MLATIAAEHPDTPAAGVGRVTGTPETGLALVTRARDGDALTIRPMYTAGDARPTAIQVTTVFRDGQASEWTPALISEHREITKRELHPEYEVEVQDQRAPGSIMFRYTITEARR